MLSNEISVENFLNLNNINIIDIRNIQSYNNNHIDGSINIPYEKLLTSPNMYLSKTKKYYIYCQKGITSSKVANILNRQGYNMISIKGGYEEWMIKK